MRLTPNIVAEAASYINCERDRTLSLRSLDIPIIENLTSLPDIYDVLDLTDNDIRVLGNLPQLLKVRTLLAARNRIASIQSDFSSQLPLLRSLSLIQNNISDFGTVKVLKSCKHLEHLSLLQTPLTGKQYYRELVIWLLPQLKVLDFAKIKDKERRRSLELFGEFEVNETALAKKLISSNSMRSVGLDKQDAGIQAIAKKLTEEEKVKLKQELKNATSLAEIDRIENALRSGFV